MYEFCCLWHSNQSSLVVIVTRQNTNPAAHGWESSLQIVHLDSRFE